MPHPCIYSSRHERCERSVACLAGFISTGIFFMRGCTARVARSTSPSGPFSTFTHCCELPSNIGGACLCFLVRTMWITHGKSHSSGWGAFGLFCAQFRGCGTRQRRAYSVDCRHSAGAHRGAQPLFYPEECVAPDAGRRRLHHPGPGMPHSQLLAMQRFIISPASVPSSAAHPAACRGAARPSACPPLLLRSRLRVRIEKHSFAAGWAQGRAGTRP